LLNCHTFCRVKLIDVGLLFQFFTLRRPVEMAGGKFYPFALERLDCQLRKVVEEQMQSSGQNSACWLKEGYMRVAAIVYVIIACSSLMVLPAFSSEAEPAKELSAEFSGLADSYGEEFYGKKTASGAVLKKDRLTAAHRLLPFGTKVSVTSKRTKQSCIVVINDRGPFTEGRIIDLSYEAARRLGLASGTAPVTCRIVAEDELEEE
jgi:rare lipoprotein A